MLPNWSKYFHTLRKPYYHLAASRADMLAIAHDHEATIEELQSANEEVVSNNEELRTLNEELETSKEEIESTNDELLQANQKLQVHAEQVEELNKYSDTIIATIHNPMLILDKNFCIKSANKPFYKQFHINHDIEGKNLYTFNNHQWKIPQLRRLLEEIVPMNTQLYNFELSHTFKDLGEKILLLNARLIRMKNNNELLLIMLVIEDVTEQATLRRNSQKLLTELKEANQALEDMNAELTAFNYISSHDLQEPLRKINTFSNYIMDEEYDALSDHAKNYFKRIKGSVDHMQTLIQDLLTYSQTSIKERKFVKTNITKIINEVKKELAEEIKEKNAIIEIGKLDEIKTIGFQFHQLMVNLIGNALKYSSKKRQLHILIKSKISKGDELDHKELLPETNYCHITAKDNGIGFDPKYNERVFGVFERLHGKDEYMGTGIGLAICKRIVRNQNGFITASGKLNKGTTIDIYIPV